MLALKFCSMSLSKDLLSEKKDYDTFISQFNSTI
jgi:hypothetical protein